MRNKNYFEELGLEPSQLENMLDAATERIFMFSRIDDCDAASFRFKSAKAKYRVVSHQKRSENRLGL